MKKRQAIKLDILNLFNHYRRKKKKIAWHIFYSALLMFVCVVFWGGKLFHPYHLILGLFFFCLSLFTFGRLLVSYRNDKIELSTYKIGKHYINRYKLHIIITLFFLLFVYVFSVLMPLRGSPFKGMASEEVNEIISHDLSEAVIVIDKLDLISEELFASDILDKKELTSEEREKLIRLWTELLKVLAEENVTAH